MRLRVLFHDNCFDGASSAALFSAFYRSCFDQNAIIDYAGLSHGPGDPFNGKFIADSVQSEHVCLDFRYTKDARMSWWVDHHLSAFSSLEDKHFFEETKNPRHFYDPTAKSCTKFLATICEKFYGYNIQPHEELIYWADLIDSAQFESPKSAVELQSAPLQLMTWVEANQNKANKILFINDLQTKKLDEIVQENYIQQLLVPLLETHQQNISLMRNKSALKNGVVVYDLLDEGECTPNKFISYYLYPDCHYVVGLSKSHDKIKISVGSNPWYAHRRTVNIADLCAFYGGGGHPVVGAISLTIGDTDKARELSQLVVKTLERAVLEKEQ